jgi:hypothetical protein
MQQRRCRIEIAESPRLLAARRADTNQPANYSPPVLNFTRPIAPKADKASGIASRGLACKLILAAKQSLLGRSLWARSHE